jgi:hypothetical protein
MRQCIIRLLVSLNPYIMALLPIRGGMRSYNWPLLVNMVFDWFTASRDTAQQDVKDTTPAPVAIYVGDTFTVSPPACEVFVVDTELPGPMPEPLPAPEPMAETVEEDVRLIEEVPAPLPMTPAPVSPWRFMWKGEPCEPVNDDLNNLTKPQLTALGKERGVLLKPHWKKDQMVSVLLAALRKEAA